MPWPRRSCCRVTPMPPPESPAASPPRDGSKFRITVAYDGTAYEGWQMQKTGTGVQEKVEQALARIFPSHPRLHGSSRTDTGVHALGLVAHFETGAGDAGLTPAKLLLAIN